MFDGCIAYCNSDDGWDLFAKTATGPIGVVTIRNCVAFGNGTLSDGVHYANGDMNGFKLGGSGVGTAHKVMNCLAFNNGATGFTDNNNPSNLTLMNLTAWGNGKYAKKGNYLCYRAASGAIYQGLISASAADSDKFTGKMSNSIYYNSGKYYRLSGSLLTAMASGDKKGNVVTDPAKTSGMFKNTNNSINLNKDINDQLRTSDGTVNMNSLYETTGSYASMGARFNVANQIIKVSGNSSSSEEETKQETTTKATEKETETTTKATEKATETTTKATEAATKATEATTKATEATTKATEKETSAESSQGKKLILNANDAATGKLKSSKVVDGFKIVATSSKTVTVDKNSKEYKGISFTKRIKLGGEGSTDARSIAFKTAGESKVKIYAISSNTDEKRKIKIIDKNGNDVTSTSTVSGSSIKYVSFTIDEAGEYFIVSESGGVNIYYVEVSNGIAY